MNPKIQELARLFHDVGVEMKQMMRREFEHLGITMPQGLVIGTLFKKKRCKISELSEELSLSNSTVSGIVDRLERQHIVLRERSEDDRRIVHVRLSPAFEDMHSQFHFRAGTMFEKILKNADAADVDDIYRGLKVLKKYLAGDAAVQNDGTHQKEKITIGE